MDKQKPRYLVEVAPGMRFECRVGESLALKAGDEVVVKFEKYEDWGRILRQVNGCGGCGGGDAGRDDEDDEDRRQSRRSAQGEEIPTIVRHMSMADRGRASEDEARANSMFKTAQRKIREHHLAMKLVHCHYSFDKSIVFFQFTADGRVDFRNLVKDLSGALHTRVELRQIGVRDEAGIVGGIGPCGRPFCCASVLDRFYSVNVKMAKIQRLSLNPASVSGGCGRLKCCLRYEVEGYREMCRQLPRSGSFCETPDGPGRVVDCNALTQRIRVRLADGDAQYKDYQVSEIKVIPRDNERSGPPQQENAGDGKPQGGRRSGRSQQRRPRDNQKAKDAS